MSDLIKRDTVLDHFRVTDPEGTFTYCSSVLTFVEGIPAENPYTQNEMKEFLHGISLHLLSLKSAQSWKYSDDTAHEIESLEVLYEKVKDNLEKLRQAGREVNNG